MRVPTGAQPGFAHIAVEITPAMPNTRKGDGGNVHVIWWQTLWVGLKRFWRSAMGIDNSDPQRESDNGTAADSLAEFRLLYQNTARDITEHVRYQAELSGSVGADSKMVKRFAIEDYGKRFTQFLRNHDLLGPAADEFKAGEFLLLLLLPPAAWEIQLDRDGRLKLFCVTFRALTAERKGTPDSLFWGLYERVKNGGNFYGHQSEDILPQLRDAAFRLDVEFLKQKEATSEKKLQSFRETTPDIIYRAAGMIPGKHKAADIDQLHKPRGLVGLSLLMAASLGILIAPQVPVQLVQAILGHHVGDSDIAVFKSFGAFLLLWSVIKAFRLGGRRARKQLFEALQKEMIRRGHTDARSVQLYARTQFGYRE